MTIRSNGEVVVPGTTDRSIGITNGDGGRGIVANDRIGSRYPDTSNRINPDNNGSILAGT